MRHEISPEGREFGPAFEACRSADELIALHPQLLDPKIMLGHYSAEVLFSPTARARFVAPDVEPIPEH